MTPNALPEVATLQTKFGHRSLLRSDVGKINSRNVGVALEEVYLSWPDAVTVEVRHKGNTDDLIFTFYLKESVLDPPPGDEQKSWRKYYYKEKVGFKA